MKSGVQSDPDLDKREEDGRAKGIGKPIKQHGVTQAQLLASAEAYLREKLEDPDYKAPVSIRWVAVPVVVQPDQQKAHQQLGK